MADRFAFREGQRDDWNAVGPGWAHWFDTFERGGAPITARMLELGRLRPGHHVIDVGTGLGEPAISAARLVGPRGLIVGVDLSERMLAVARARAAGLSNVVCLHQAVEDFDPPAESFDVVLSRWCLMFLIDLAGTLRLLHRLLVPGGVLVAAVWGPPASAPIVGLPSRVISAHLQIDPAPPGQPGLHGMSDPRWCERTLADAGFADVTVRAESAPFSWDSSRDYARFAWEILPPSVKQMLTDWCTPADRAAIREELIGAADAYAEPGGKVRLPSTVLCLRAVKPAPPRRRTVVTPR